MNKRSVQISGSVIRFGTSVVLGLSTIFLPAPPITTIAWGQQFLADDLRRQAERVIGDAIRSVPSSQAPSRQVAAFRGGGPDRIEYDRIHDYTPQIAARTLQNSTGEMRSSAFGKILIIHPFPSTPAVMERTAYLAGDHPSLEFSVRGHPRGDMLVRVWATPERGRSARIYDQTIVGRNGWQTESIDLARYRGQTVTVRFEVHATGWHYEYAALDSFFIEGAAERTAGELVRTAASRPAGLGPEWLGRWKSQDGKRVLLISRSKIEFSDLRKDDDGKSRWVTYEHDWSNAREPSNDGAAGFGYAKNSTSPGSVAKRYEDALRSYKQDPTDSSISDPAQSRQAISAISPGTYKVMWSHGGGDCDYGEYIVDGGRMLEVSECKYGFDVRLFDRAR